MQQSVTAEANLQDVAAMVAALRRSKEPLMHCAVYIDLAADSLEALRTLRDTVTGELIRSRLEADGWPECIRVKVRAGPAGVLRGESLPQQLLRQD